MYEFSKIPIHALNTAVSAEAMANSSINIATVKGLNSIVYGVRLHVNTRYVFAEKAQYSFSVEIRKITNIHDENIVYYWISRLKIYFAIRVPRRYMSIENFNLKWFNVNQFLRSDEKLLKHKYGVLWPDFMLHWFMFQHTSPNWVDWFFIRRFKEKRTFFINKIHFNVLCRVFTPNFKPNAIQSFIWEKYNETIVMIYKPCLYQMTQHVKWPGFHIVFAFRTKALPTSWSLKCGHMKYMCIRYTFHVQSYHHE